MFNAKITSNYGLYMHTLVQMCLELCAMVAIMCNSVLSSYVRICQLLHSECCMFTALLCSNHLLSIKANLGSKVFRILYFISQIVMSV